jgi:polyisoprenoid-binding protein YceI
MKNLFLLFILLTIALNSQAQNSVKFRIKNAGLTVPGYFSVFKPMVSWDKSNPSKSIFVGEVQVSSVNTNNKARDKHLKTADFFDVEKFPIMKFESTSVSAISASKIKITGKLTIKDVTKTVSFDTDISEMNGKTVFKSSLLINRLDYKVGASSWTLSNDLYIDLNIEK